MKFIDSHAHLYQEDFDDDLPSVITNAKKMGLSQVLLPNIDLSTIARLHDTCKQYPDFFKPMMGLHPTSVAKDFREDLELIKRLVFSKKGNYIAIGEVGLDFYWDTTYKNEQIMAFKEQLMWGIELDLPIVIHAREAYKELEELLKSPTFKQARGVIHSFSGEEEDLNRFLPLENWMIGINGIVTFKNASLSKFVQKIPINRLLIETDSPYLAPVPLRGKRNESAFLYHTLSKLANIYGVSVESMAKETLTNTRNLFRI